MVIASQIETFGLFELVLVSLKLNAIFLPYLQYDAYFRVGAVGMLNLLQSLFESLFTSCLVSALTSIDIGLEFVI